MTYKIASFNMANMSFDGKKDLDRIAAIINDNHLDIVAMQEVLSEGKLLTGIQSSSATIQAKAYERSLQSRLRGNWEIEKMDSQQLEDFYYNLTLFCRKEQLREPEVCGTRQKISDGSLQKNRYFDEQILWGGAIPTEEKKRKFIRILEDSMPHLLLSNAAHTTVYINSGNCAEDFKNYFQSKGLTGSTWESTVLEVIADNSPQNLDLWLTLNGFILVQQGSISNVWKYEDAEFEQQDGSSKCSYLNVDWPDKYDNQDVDFNVLQSIMKKLGELDK